MRAASAEAAAQEAEMRAASAEANAASAWRLRGSGSPPSCSVASSSSSPRAPAQIRDAPPLPMAQRIATGPLAGSPRVACNQAKPPSNASRRLRLKAHTVSRSAQAWTPRVLPAGGGEREPHAPHAALDEVSTEDFTKALEDDQMFEPTRRQAPALPTPSASQEARGPRRPVSAAPTASKGKQMEPL